jgi:hypothetical protein
MTYLVTIAAGKKDVVLPNQNRYQGGAAVALSDDEYGQMSATARSSLLSATAYQGEAVAHTVTLKSTVANVTLPNLQRYNASASVTLSDAQYSTIDPAAKTALFLSDVAANQVAVESAPAALATSGTIATAGVGASVVTTTGAVTSAVLQPGTASGQQVTVVNQSANSITFAATGSNVASGNSAIIAANTSRLFTWDSITSLWY